MELWNGRRARFIGASALGIALTAVAACGAGGGNDPNIDPYLKRFQAIAGVSGGPEVIAAGQRYCAVKLSHKDKPDADRRAAALEEIRQGYNLEGPQLNAVADAANEALCPNY
jgi:hypothetical protein